MNCKRNFRESYVFHCLVIKVVSLSAICDSLFTLSYLSNLVKNFFQKFFEIFKIFLKFFVIHSSDLSTLSYFQMLVNNFFYFLFSNLPDWEKENLTSFEARFSISSTFYFVNPFFQFFTFFSNSPFFCIVMNKTRS